REPAQARITKRSKGSGAPAPDKNPGLRSGISTRIFRYFIAPIAEWPGNGGTAPRAPLPARTMGIMLFFVHGWIIPQPPSPARAMQSIPGAVLAALLLSAPISRAASPPEQPVWMEVEETVIPLRKNTTRNAEILGLVRRGQVLAVEIADGNWIKVRV